MLGESIGAIFVGNGCCHLSIRRKMKIVKSGDLLYTTTIVGTPKIKCVLGSFPYNRAISGKLNLVWIQPRSYTGNALSRIVDGYDFYFSILSHSQLIARRCPPNSYDLLLVSWIKKAFRGSNII